MPAFPGDDPNAIKDLNEIAPAPAKPRLYKPGQRYYRVPVTFEVELDRLGGEVGPVVELDALAQGPDVDIRLRVLALLHQPAGDVDTGRPRQHGRGL